VVIDLSVIEGDYFRDLLEQPKALQDTLQHFEESTELKSLVARLHKGKFTTVVLTGMGSSFHALHTLLLPLTELGIPTMLVETSELIYYGNRLFRPDSLVVAMSQSGQSAEIIRLLEVNRKRAPIIAVTNTADSPLARRSAATVLTYAGQEFSVSCKTYIAGLVALKFLADQLCRLSIARTKKELQPVLGPAAEYLAGWKEHVQAMLPMLQGIRQLFLVGRGYSLATAGTGALILKESTQFPSEGLSSAAFRHGPFEMVSPETFVLVFGGGSKTEKLNRRLFEDIQKHCGKGAYVHHDQPSPFRVPKVAASLLPMLEILPVQILTLALAAMVGRQPGQFRFASKITSTE